MHKPQCAHQLFRTLHSYSPNSQSKLPKSTSMQSVYYRKSLLVFGPGLYLLVFCNSLSWSRQAPMLLGLCLSVFHKCCGLILEFASVNLCNICRAPFRLKCCC